MSHNVLMNRVNVSGSHSSGDDLIKCAYNMCGALNRGKDINIFFFYMMVRDHDLAFLRAVLDEDECASETFIFPRFFLLNSSPELFGPRRLRSRKALVIV